MTYKHCPDCTYLVVSWSRCTECAGRGYSWKTLRDCWLCHGSGRMEEDIIVTIECPYCSSKNTDDDKKDD
jgi:DnaJ-class molecular chaperone